MPLKTLDPKSKQLVYAYLDDVLTYYKTAEEASLGEWPTQQIGWQDIPLGDPFYKIVIKWFQERNVEVIMNQRGHRYLSTFILAAEFPPTLGYGQLVQELVNKKNWFSLYFSAETTLQAFINSINLNAYTIAQQQSLTSGSPGYDAFLQLIQILSSIRYYLDNYDNLDSICTQVADLKGWDLDLVLRIAHAYKGILIPPQRENNQATYPSPKFTYQLIQDGLDWRLVLKHNLNKVSIPLPSAINLPKFSSGTLSFLSDRDNIVLDDSERLVEVEVQEGFLVLKCSSMAEFIPIKTRNTSLQKIQFIVTVKDLDAKPHQLYLGQVKRNKPFLIFGQNGTELYSSTYIYKMGEILRIVPLSNTIGQFLLKSSDFTQEEFTSNLPVFKSNNTQVSSIVIGKTCLQFRRIPFSFRLREQTAWEATFKKFLGTISYFFSPMLEIYLEGDFPKDVTPNLSLIKFNKRNGEIIVTDTINPSYSKGKITPVRPLKSPGQYKLTVKFPEDEPCSMTFNLLPIKSARLLGNKHIQLKLFSPPKEIKIQSNDQCKTLVKGELLDIEWAEYGIHEFQATFKYRNAENQEPTTTINFNFEAIEEIVGHFKTTVTSKGNQEPLLIEEDLIANSYLEFQRTSLRDSTKPYKISAYMEYSSTALRIFPESQVMYTDGSRKYALSLLVNYVKRNQFSRLLLIVEYEGTELYRAEFRSKRRPILDLEKEWNHGAFSSLAALPLDSLELQEGLDFDSLPPNSLVYGMVANQSEKHELNTFPTFIAGKQPTSGLTDIFLAKCNEYMIPDEEMTEHLKQILQSPEESFKLFRWLSKAWKWSYPNDIKIFAKILDTFPILVAWAELARNPANREESFALISLEAKIMKADNKYYLPDFASISNHPRFSPELITLNDLEELDRINLLAKDGHPAELFWIYCKPFISGGKPVLSWLTLFWLRKEFVKQNRAEVFSDYYQRFRESTIPIAATITKESFTFTPPDYGPPSYQADQFTEQDFEELLNKEQVHYDNPPLSRIPKLKTFLDVMKEPGFSIGLAALFRQPPLLYAEPNLKGFESSTKWKCIIFLSLTAVCTQLNKQPWLETLERLHRFNHKTYIYLLKWVSSHEETARIYNCYYEYWMERFWEEENV
ncbi:MAG: hypothetical protein EOM45_03580 [Clostridia bacterium]|nr:hypothetical protein [Clostridia bacterium]